MLIDFKGTGLKIEGLFYKFLIDNNEGQMQNYFKIVAKISKVLVSAALTNSVYFSSS